MINAPIVILLMKPARAGIRIEKWPGATPDRNGFGTWDAVLSYVEGIMELFESLSDDQKALVGCAAALCVSGLLMALSFRVKRKPAAQQTIPLPQRPEKSASSDEANRRAA